MGDVEGELASLLDALEYLQVSSARTRLPIEELNRNLQDASTHSEVQKAFFRHAGFTILVDPEMVVAELGKEQIKRLCSEHSISAISVIWERVSETVIAQEWTFTGELRESLFVGGSPPKDAPRPAHTTLSAQPNPVGVKALLQERGIPTELFAANVDATVVALAGS